MYGLRKNKVREENQILRMLFLSKRNIVMAERENLKIYKATDRDREKFGPLPVLYSSLNRTC